MDRERRIAVVGGGVSGLATAYRLAEAGVDVTVFEADERPGGKLRSIDVGGFTLPAGADSFLARKPWALELCKELGLGVELVSPGASSAFLWTEGGLQPFLRDAPFGIPGDVANVFRWPGLSRAGRARAAKDLLIRARRSDEDESLGSLLRRRLGNEATEWAVVPLLEGLFAGDADRLSVQATFPELVFWERSQGSLIRGSQAAMRNARGGTPGPMFMKPREGVQRITEVLADRLGAQVRAGKRVTGIGTEDGACTISVDGAGMDPGTGGGADGRSAFDVVVIATPASVAAELLGETAPLAARELVGIPYASTGVVLLVYPEGTQADLPRGTGFVVPRGMAPMTASTWISSKWPDEAFGTHAVVRCYVGGVGAEDILEATEADLIEGCARHLAAIVPLPQEPEHAAVVRWPKAMPQYEVGHLDLVARIRGALPAGIFLTGQAYDGVGIPDCIRAANETAQAVLTHLEAQTRSGQPVDR